MLISEAEIQRIKQTNPLLGYLQAKGFKLKRKGKQYFIHCPFHSDTNESFAVDPYTGTAGIRVKLGHNPV